MEKRTDSGLLSVVLGEILGDACVFWDVGGHTLGALEFGSMGGPNAAAKSGSFMR